MDVLVGEVVIPGEAMLVAIGSGHLDAAALHVGVHARRERGVGDDIVRAVEIGEEHLARLDIGHDLGAALPILRGGGGRGERAQGGRAEDPAADHAPPSSWYS
ncbi:MAG: hypothetical protein DI610_03015 [Staphylococcus hominis]|nr:MAG: hypothetical protein DI610_03015 [Staphylococcus hominis]